MKWHLEKNKHEFLSHTVPDQRWQWEQKEFRAKNGIVNSTSILIILFFFLKKIPESF